MYQMKLIEQEAVSFLQCYWGLYRMFKVGVGIQSSKYIHNIKIQKLYYYCYVLFILNIPYLKFYCL